MIVCARAAQANHQSTGTGQHDLPLDVPAYKQPEQHRSKGNGKRCQAEAVAPVDQPQWDVGHAVCDPQDVIQKRRQHLCDHWCCHGKCCCGQTQQKSADEADRCHPYDQQVAHKREHRDISESAQQDGCGENSCANRTGQRAYYHRNQLFRGFWRFHKRPHQPPLHPAGKQDQAERRRKRKLQAHARDRIRIDKQQQTKRCKQGIQAVRLPAGKKCPCRDQIHHRSAENRRCPACDRHEKHDQRDGNPRADTSAEQQVAERDQKRNVHTGDRNHVAQPGDAERKCVLLRQAVCVADQQPAEQAGLSRRKIIRNRLIAEPCDPLRQPSQLVPIRPGHGKGQRLTVLGFRIRACDIASVGCLISCAVESFRV